MRAIFGVVSLLIVLAVVGIVVTKQMKAVDKTVGTSLPPAQTGTDTGRAVAPAAETVRQQSQQVQQQVKDDLAKAMEQAASRNEAADK